MIKGNWKLQRSRKSSSRATGQIDRLGKQTDGQKKLRSLALASIGFHWLVTRRTAEDLLRPARIEGATRRDAKGEERAKSAARLEIEANRFVLIEANEREEQNPLID